MPRKPPSTSQPPATTASEHRPAGHNPRNIPERGLDASPPQPDAPEQSEVDQQQDQQPVIAEPLLKKSPHPNRGTREERNG